MRSLFGAFLREVSLTSVTSLPGPTVSQTLIGFTYILVEAQSLIEFWQENFKVQVEARSGVLQIHHEDGMSLLLLS